MFVKSIKISAILALSIMASACSQTFVVVGEFPQPLVIQTAESAQLIYSAEFKNYEYLEKDEKRALKKVSLGEAQVNLFDRIFDSLFRLVGAESEAQQADLKIEPQVLDFQYSMPAETKSTQFEIWVKYRLKITGRNGQEIADWVVKGYGKTPKAMMSSYLKSFNTAANIALRDVGAQLAIGFRNQPSVKSYLSKGSKLPTPKTAVIADGKDGSAAVAIQAAPNAPSVSGAATTIDPPDDQEREEPK